MDCKAWILDSLFLSPRERENDRNFIVKKNNKLKVVRSDAVELFEKLEGFFFVFLSTVPL